MVLLDFFEFEQPTQTKKENEHCTNLNSGPLTKTHQNEKVNAQKNAQMQARQM